MPMFAGIFLTLIAIFLLLDIKKSAQNRDLFSLITFSFILIYGLSRPIHFMLGDDFLARLYLFGSISNPKFPIQGMTIYTFSYCLFYFIYKIFLYYNPIKIEIIDVHRRVPAKGVFIFAIILYTTIPLLKELHGFFQALNIVAVFCILLIHRTMPIKSDLIAYLTCLILLFLLFYTTTARRDVLVAVFASIGMAYQNPFLKKYATNIFFSFIAFLVIASFALFMRSGINYKDGDILKSELLTQMVVRKVETELDFSIVTDTTSYAIENAYTNNRFFWGEGLFKPFLYFIPRSVYPDKPETMSRTVAKENFYGFYLIGGSTPPGIMGEGFLNFGFLGILIYAVLYSYYVVVCKKMLAHQSLIVSQFAWSLGASTFYLLRGPLDTVLIPFLVVFVSVIYIRNVVVVRKK